MSTTKIRSLCTLLACVPLMLFAQDGAVHVPSPLTGPSVMSIARGLLGMAAMIAIAWVFSAKRKQVDWKVVGIGLAFQIADDILDYDNTRTQHQRNVVDTWFHTSLLPRLMAQTGRAIVIGNTYHHSDTIALLRRSEGWVSCHIPLLSESEEVVASITYPSDFTGRPIGVSVAGALPT